MTAPASAHAEAYDHCEAQVKATDRSGWLATLFAPAAARPALHALGAFLLEIGAVRRKVREPLAGELRLQWWADAIAGEARGEVGGNPVAAALLDTIERYRLPTPALIGLLDAKREDLYDAPPSTWAEFDAWADRTEGAALGLRAAILGEVDPTTSEAALRAGRVAATLGALHLLARSRTARPEMRFPTDLLDRHGIGTADLVLGRPAPALRAVLADLAEHAAVEVSALRRLRAGIGPAVAPAFLTVNLVLPGLKAVQRDTQPFWDRALELPQWRQQWILWRASRRNGIL